MESMNDIFVRNLKLPAITVPAGIAVLGTDMPKLMEQNKAQINVPTM